MDWVLDLHECAKLTRVVLQVEAAIADVFFYEGVHATNTYVLHS